jgi:hypothetical protein
MLASLCRLLASARAAAASLTVLAVVSAVATWLEGWQGRESAQWFVYRSPWFVALLGAISLQTLAAILVRLPWQRRQRGPVLTLVGVLTLLGGSIWTCIAGVEGRISLGKGQRCDEIVRPDRSRITLHRPGRPDSTRTHVPLRPGPTDWPDRRTLALGVHDGLGLKVVKYYRHARQTAEWVAGDINDGSPALRLLLSSPNGQPVAEEWLSSGPYGGEAVLGPTRCALLPIPTDTMLEDFLDPPDLQPGQPGVLSVHHQGKCQRIAVRENLGQRISLGSSGAALQICDYLPNARPAPNGRFVSAGEKPLHPLLELLVYLPDRAEPVRQVAFARLPLLNLDAVRGFDLPVRFWYHHADAPLAADATFLQTPTGQLYCQVQTSGTHHAVHKARAGTRLPVGQGLQLTVEQHLPWAHQMIRCAPAPPNPNALEQDEAAVLVECSLGNDRREVWLQREDIQSGPRRVLTSLGLVELSFEYERIPLGFEIELHDFERERDLSGTATASASVVAITINGRTSRQRIAWNAPVVCAGYRLCQARFWKPPGQREMSELIAVRDPGRPLKYLGSFLAGIGVLWTFCLRGPVAQRGQAPSAESTESVNPVAIIPRRQDRARAA